MLSTIDFLVSIQTATGDLPRTYPEWDRYTVYWCGRTCFRIRLTDRKLKYNATGATVLVDSCSSFPFSSSLIIRARFHSERSASSES